MTSSIPGPKVLLMGESGTGKTFAIRSLLEVGITPFIIFTEPGMEVLGDLPKDKCHWTYIPPTGDSFAAMLDMSKKVNALSFEALTKIADSNRSQYGSFVKVIQQCIDFKCERTGESFGDIGKWGTDRALVVDSLSGISDMAMQLVVGGKAVRGMQDWMVAQNMVESLINKLCVDLECTFILTAHIEREKDEITGGTQVMVSTLGKKLAPKLPRYFSDVVLTVREADKFYWDTAAMNVATKTRNLPIGAKQIPSFVPLIKEWKRKSGTIAT